MEEDKLHTLSAHIVGRLNQNIHKQGIELQKMILGIEILLSSIPKLILILCLSVILGITERTLFILFAFGMIRRYSFGLHAKTHLACTAVSVLFFVVTPYVCTGVKLNSIVLVILFLFVIITLYKYAPADTENRPLLGAKKRDTLKKKAITSSIFLLLLTLALCNKNFNTLAAAGAVYAVAVILPVTYKILRRREHNHEQYE